MAAMNALRLALALPRALRRMLRELAADELERARFPHVNFGEGVILRGGDRMSFGSGSFIDNRSYLSAGTLNNRRGYIRAGAGTEIGPCSVFWGAGGITIGDNVHVGTLVNITTECAKQVGAHVTDAVPALEMEFAPVVIEDNVLIASGSTIVLGVHIGHHAFIGAGSVVVDDIPPYAFAIGNPARVIRYNNVPTVPATAVKGAVPL